jgi:rRNA maturation endonuclease Nob1
MTKHCNNCDKDFDCTLKKCPACGAKLKEHYTKEELEQIQKENDDVAAITMIL